MRSRILLQWIAGTLGGLIGWLIVEPIPYLTTDPGPNEPIPVVSWPSVILFGMITGGAISACIGAAYAAGSPARARRAAFIGALAGVVGGGLGLAVGQTVYSSIQTASEYSTLGRLIPAASVIGMLLARSLGWAAVGAGMGLLQGAINGSVQRSVNGLVGGLVGGFIGGAVFELLSQTVQVTMNEGRSPFFFLNGPLLRGISLTVTGSSIGLFVGLTERALRTAWVRVLAGRGEGMEFLLEKAENSIGRDELSDIPLFGDPAVARRHAVIRRSGGGYVLDALEPGVSVDGQGVRSAPLSDGAVISVVSRSIEFHQRGAPRAAGSRDVARPATAALSSPEGICPYCGERRRPDGSCACSPAASPAPARAGASRLLLRSTGGAPSVVFPLDEGEVSVGREPGCDLVVPDRSVSRRHATLSVRPDDVTVADAGSSNGTFVNGRRIHRESLRPGDEVRFGATAFRLEVD